LNAIRGRCGAAPLGAVARVKRDEIGPYVEIKDVVRSASVSAALMRVRACPYALARAAAGVMRIARRTHAGLQSFAECAPDAPAGLIDLVELARAEVDHVHAVERREKREASKHE
jgi:hypothetical protein